MRNEASNKPQIRTATMDDLNVMAKVLAEGFHDDPPMVWSMNGTKAIEPMLRVTGKALYLAKGYGTISENQDGATFWLKPGTPMHMSALDMAKVAWVILRNGGLTAVRRGLEMSAAMEKGHPKEPHYYLFTIATLPSARGKGVGGALLKEGLARADAEGVGVYLENSKEDNLGFYQAHGFELLNIVHPAKGSPPMWRMWRKPQSH